MRGIATVLFLLYAFALPAQQIVEGTVKSKATALPLESVVALLHDNKDNTLAYGFTDAKGYFRLVFETQTDSLFLEISLLGYESCSFTLSEPFRKLDIALNQKDIQLKEVKINPKYVGLKEDTIVYNVLLLQTQNDRNIGDVLKKIPGIEVSKSGGVTYEGNSINTFYIEGMDLLKQKYGIAVNNVPVDAVSNVEVIENHQPVKLLKGEVSSFTAAINLRLKDKNKFRPTGTAEAGGGYDFNDILWLLKVFGLNVQQKSQALLMYKTNNTGKDITLEMSDQTLSSSDRDELRYNPVQFGLLHETGFSNPPIEEPRYLFNQTHTASLNQLWKTGTDNQLRLNVNYVNDARKEETAHFSSYFLEDSAFVINEYQILKRRENSLDGMLTYTDNSSARYIDNALKMKMSWADTRFDIQNQLPIFQKFVRSHLNIQNNLRFTKKIGSKIWNLQSYIGYFSLPQQLTVQKEGTDSASNQQIERKGFYTNNNTYWLHNFSRFSIQVKGELEASSDGLDTDLKYTGRVDSLSNRINSDFIKLALTAYYRYKLRKFDLSAELPFVYYGFNIKDNQYNSRNLRNYVYLNTQISFSYAFDGLTTVRASGAYNQDVGNNLSDFLTSYIMPDYKSLQSAGIQAETTGLRYSLRLNHKDALNGFYYNISGSYNKRKRNRVAQQRFLNGMIVSGYSALDNYTDSWSGIGYIAKNFFYQGITLSLTTQYMQNKSEKQQQGILYPVRNQILLLAPRITLILKRTATFTYETNFTDRQTDIYSLVKGKIKNSLNQLSQKLQGHYFVNNKMEINAQAEYLHNEIAPSVHSQLAFVDLGFTYKHKNLNFELNWNNILNQKNYTYTSYGELDTYQYVYALRPQSILASIVFKY
ncbi:TonB-dependent receptor [Bacteroidia bacterium]|nr:TonB-dependent receptor [Bacteroidia bacterium]